MYDFHSLHWLVSAIRKVGEFEGWKLIHIKRKWPNVVETNSKQKFYKIFGLKYCILDCDMRFFYKVEIGIGSSKLYHKNCVVHSHMNMN